MHAASNRTIVDSFDTRLSTRLRMARHIRGMTLKLLATSVGCSESLLSKIENGKVTPSLPMLNRLAQAFGVGIGWIFEDWERSEPVIARAGQRPIAALEAIGYSITVEKVIPDSSKYLLRCNIFHVEAGASSSGGQQHTGEEVGYLLDGQLELLINGRMHQLSAGEAFALRSDQPHSFRNDGPTRASIFWVQIPSMA